MAEAPSVELAVEETAAKPSKLKPLIFLAAGVVLAAGGTLGTLYFMGILPPQSQVAAETAADSAPEVPQEAIYIDLSPAFTVNFRVGDRSRFLQVSLQAMARDPAVESLVKQHMPAVRNDLMMLFSGGDPEKIATREGKVALQGEVVKTINAILQAETDTPGIEAAYFTGFVMQ